VFKIAVKISDSYPQEAPEVGLGGLGNLGTRFALSIARMHARATGRSCAQILFKTSVWHPNVHPESGKPCIDSLRDQWKAHMTLRDVFVFIRELLAAPNASESHLRVNARESARPPPSIVCAPRRHRPHVRTRCAGDSVNSEAARQINESLDSFEAQAAAFTKKYAMEE